MEPLPLSLQWIFSVLLLGDMKDTLGFICGVNQVMPLTGSKQVINVGVELVALNVKI